MFWGSTVAQLSRTERRPESGDERRTERAGSDTCQASAHQPSSIESEAVVLEDPDKIWVVRLYLFLFAIDGLVRFEDRPVGQVVSESGAVADAVAYAGCPWSVCSKM